ncbi:MAG: tetratricopeptide repeat protein [Chitinivibrionales bacterium]
MMNTLSKCSVKVLAGMFFLFAALSGPSAEETGDYIHYRLGVKYKNENKFDQATEEFRKVLTAYPDNYNAYMQLAEIRKSQNQPRLVIYNLKKALAYNPGWGKAHRMLADAYEQDRQFQNAIMELQIYQQSCDPAEQDGVQKKIDQLVKKVQGRGISGAEPEAPAAQPERKDTAVVKEPKAAATPVPVPVQVVKPFVKKSQKAAAPSRAPSAPGSGTTTAIAPAAEALLKKAINLYEQGKIEESLQDIKKAVLVQPHYPEAYYYGGLARYKQGKIDLAKINFSKSFDCPKCQPAHFYLGKIYGSEKYYKGAISELTTYIQNATDKETKKEATGLLAQYKKLTGDTSGVIEEAEADQEARPEFEPAVPESGYSVIELRIDSLLAMRVVDTLTDPGQAMLGGVKEFKAGHFDNAIKEFKKVIVGYPAASVAAPCAYDIGVCYMKLRLFSNAENQFDNLRNRYPSHALASQSLFLKAFSYLERGDEAVAEKLFREFIQKYRNHAWTGKAYEKLGDIYSDLKQFNKALDAYNQAAVGSKDETDRLYAYFKQGNVYFEAGNSERAVASFKKVIDIGESRGMFVRVPDSYYKIADCKYQQKDNKSALEYYQKATRKYPAYQETPWGLFQMGNIYKNVKNYPKAIETYKELAKNFPDDYWAKQARWKMEDAVWENEYKTVLQ